MFQRITKSILNLLNFRRTTLLVLLFFIVLGSVVPIFQANALETPTLSKWDVFLTGIPGLLVLKKGLETLGITGSDMANAILTAAFMALISISLVFLKLSQALLNWVISPDFISVPFTNNPIVNLGWTTVRDFVNMLFILVLVIIALGSALRIKEYEVKKLLPTLILIAVLINFTPVICGFIIDASNIVMNIFLSQELLSKGFVDTLSNEINMVSDLKNPADKLGGGAVLVFFNLIGAIIFLLFALLFAVRYVALWILVILSPIAFFCYILPQTKGVWSAWWKQFTQWSIIGIIGGFFIYLTNITIVEIVENKGIVNPPSPSSDINTISGLVMYIIPLIFLVIGFFMSIQTSAIGADKILGFAQGTGKKLYGFTKGKVKESALVKGQAEKWRQRFEKIPERVGTERMTLEAKAKHIEKNKQRTEEQQKLYSSMSSEDIIKHAKTESERAAMMMELIKRKKTGKIEELEKLGVLKPGELNKDMEIAFNYAGASALEGLKDQRPDLAGDIEEITTGIPLSADDKSKEIREEVQKQQPVKFRLNTEKTPEIFKNKDVLYAINPQQYDEILYKGSEKQRDNILSSLTKEIDRLEIKPDKLDEEKQKLEEFKKTAKKFQDLSLGIEPKEPKQRKKWRDRSI